MTAQEFMFFPSLWVIRNAIQDCCLRSQLRLGHVAIWVAN